MSDAEVQDAVESGQIKFFDLEKELGDEFRAVKIRRNVIESRSKQSFTNLPYEHFDYRTVLGQCCENVIGYATVPVGVAGPLLVDGKEYYIPMATTEGCLVASATRGCKAITQSGGCNAHLIADGMCRAPVLGVPDAKTALALKTWAEINFDKLASTFNATSRFARLVDVQSFIAGRKVYMRFKCTSGDAMGMNMVGKGVEKALELIQRSFPSCSIISLSGNVCTDKKPSAINWIEGRGKSVVCDAVIKGDVIKSVLKTTVDALVELNYAKNLLGSAVAGSIGGQNAHASNIVTSIFLATGQDVAQNVESSTCMTLMEPTNDGQDLYVSVTLPSLEVGTIGGGTQLPAQSAMLSLLGVKGSDPEAPGKNAANLARIIGAAVMAGELSLMSALSSGALIKSHMKLNRREPATTELASSCPAGGQ